MTQGGRRKHGNSSSGYRTGHPGGRASPAGTPAAPDPAGQRDLESPESPESPEDREARGETRPEGIDEPVPDVVEQRHYAVPGPDEPDAGELPEPLPFEAERADVAEQAREFELGEEDYP